MSYITHSKDEFNRTVCKKKTEAHWTLYTVIPVFPHFIS